MAFPVRGSSYTEAFYAAMESQGARVVEGIFAGRWLLRHLRGVTYVHVHWPSFFYNERRRVDCLHGFALFLFLLALARLRGARVIWTVHNIYPHDPCVIPVLHRLARWILVRTAARFLVHGRSAEAEALRNFPAISGRTILIDHGHWIGYYPNAISRDAARRTLDIDDSAYVFLFIGLCKPYKNLEALIAAFEQSRPQTILVIAGRFDDPQYEARIRSAVERSPARAHIKLHTEFIPNDELQIFLNAADAVVAPYAETLTSGTAMLAVSFGRPLVAPALGSLKDVINETCGILYAPQERDGLARAMLAAQRATFDQNLIMAEARHRDWTTIAARLMDKLASI